MAKSRKKTPTRKKSAASKKPPRAAAPADAGEAAKPRTRAQEAFEKHRATAASLGSTVGALGSALGGAVRQAASVLPQAAAAALPQFGSGPPAPGAPSWGIPPSLVSMPGTPGMPPSGPVPGGPQPGANPGAYGQQLGSTLRLGMDLLNAGLAGGVQLLGGLSGAAGQLGGFAGASPLFGYGPGDGGHGHDACHCACAPYDCCGIMGADPCCHPGVGTCC